MFPCSHEPEDQPERPGEAASTPGPAEPSGGRPGRRRPRPAADAAAAAADGEGAAAPEAAGAAPPGEAPGERPPPLPGERCSRPGGGPEGPVHKVLPREALLNPRDPKLRRSRSAFLVPVLGVDRAGVCSREVPLRSGTVDRPCQSRGLPEGS